MQLIYVVLTHRGKNNKSLVLRKDLAMKVKMFLYPNYVTLQSAQTFSPNLFQFLEEEGVELEEAYWDGTLDGIPKQPAIVRASKKMECSPATFARRCQELGHLPYYDDRLILVNGDESGTRLIESAIRFLEKIGQG